MTFPIVQPVELGMNYSEAFRPLGSTTTMEPVRCGRMHINSRGVMLTCKIEKGHGGETHSDNGRIWFK